MELNEIYNLFNLSEYEKKVYYSFIEYTILKPKEVSNKSTVSYGRIYEILEKLESKQLIFLSQTNPKEYTILPIKESIKNYIDNEKNKLNQIEKKLENIEIKKIQKNNEEPITKIIKGKEQQQLIINKLHKNAKSEILGIPGNYHPPYHRRIATEKALHRGIKIKRIVQNIDEENKEFLKKCSQKGEEFKQYKIEGLRLYIKDREEAILTIVEPNNENRISIYTQNKNFSNSLALFFESLWKNN